MNRHFFNLKESPPFQYLVISIIIFNAFTIGINTYELGEFTKSVISILDYSITVFFVIELLIRFIGEPKKINFLKSGWNIFDTLIVLI
jgi:voltage-gated sodium channel